MRASIAALIAAICLSNGSARADNLTAPSERIINGAQVDIETQRSRGHCQVVDHAFCLVT